jgi:hypothetical protein
MRAFARIAILALALSASPMLAQNEDGGSGEDGGSYEAIVVTGTMRARPGAAVPVIDRRPVVGLRRPADGVVRRIEITSDSREEAMRRDEVEAMFLAALDRAKREGLSLVTGELEVTEVTRENWRTLFPGLTKSAQDDDDEDDEDYDDDDDEDDDNGRVKPGYEDDGSTATLRLRVKTKLTGSILDAQRKITAFVKAVPASGRSEIIQKGDLALTIVNPEQYRDEIYRRIAAAVTRAGGFYGPEFGAEVTGLDRELAWAQVSNTDVFLYVPYSFVVSK